jgi:hypothetical protein
VWQPTVWEGGVLTTLTPTEGFCEASVITPDGNTIFGSSYDPHTFKFFGVAWDRQGGSWVERELGALFGTAPDQGDVVPNDCTPDGRIVVGLNQFFFGNFTGFLWTEATGMVDVEDFLEERGITLPAGFDIQSLTAISDDGSVIVGIGQDTTFPFIGRTFLIRLDPAVDVPVVAAAAEGLRMSARPNPVRANGTTVEFEIPRAGTGTLAIYDTAGRLVRRLLDGPMTAGRHAVGWDGRDTAGARVAAGVYYSRLETGNARETRKLVVVR